MVNVITTLYYVAIIFHHQVWYHMLSLCYACIRSSGIILIHIPNFISFAASVAELAHGEKSRNSPAQSPSLFDASGTEAYAQNKLCTHIFAINFYQTVLSP